MQKESPCFFLGANSPKGFHSKFDQLFNYGDNCRCILIKGGPGTGKSTVLKKIAAALNAKGLSTELIYCTADCDSLDAVVTEDTKFSAVDATLPHAVEANYPGAYEEVFDLSRFWNSEMLKKNEKIIKELFNQNRELHTRARKYIAAAAELLEDAAKLSLGTISPEKVAVVAARICKKEFGKREHRQGKEKLRFLSAVTNNGVFMFENTAKILCKKIYVVEDEYGAASRIFMNTVRKAALERGLDIITCRCGIFPGEKNEHIFIPSLELGFMTSNKRHRVKTEPYRIIHAKRFLNGESAKQNKFRLRFDTRTATMLINQAVEYMKEAKNIHDRLESIYASAMDFKLAEQEAEKIINTI